MTRNKMLLGLATVAMLFAMPVPARVSPVLGTLETAAETPMGSFESTWTFAEGSDGYTIAIEDAPRSGGGEGR